MENIIVFVPYVYAVLLIFGVLKMCANVGQERGPVELGEVLLSLVIWIPLIIYLLTR